MLGGYLMEVRTQEDFELAVVFWSDLGSYYWLGGIYVEDEWRWPSNNESIEERFWVPGEPNNVNHNCVHVWRNTASEVGFADGNCFDTAKFVCEFN